MPNINKVPPSAGAQWLLDAFALFRREPLRLGLLGVTWGALAMLVLLGALLNPTLGMALQLVLALLGPFLFAGMLWAIREADQGRPVLPTHLFMGLQLGRPGSLLTTLLPQVFAGVALGVAFLVLIGQEQWQQLIEIAEKMQAVQQSGGQPDPELLKGMPVGGILLCLLLAVALAVAVTLTIFVSVPQIVFTGTPGLQALGNSLRASLRNLPAMVVMLLLLFVALLAISFGAQLLALFAQLLFGPSLARMLINLLMMAVLMPLLAGTVYFAWKQLLRDAGGDAAQASAPDRLEA